MTVKIEAYENLIGRRAAFVDSVAELRANGSEVTYQKVSDMMEEEGFEPYAEKTFEKYQWRLSDAIDERETVFINRRGGHDGDVRVENGTGSYQGPVEGLDQTMQHISERPYEAAEMEQNKTEGVLVAFEVDKDRLFSLLRSDDKELAQEVYESVVWPHVTENE